MQRARYLAIALTTLTTMAVAPTARAMVCSGDYCNGTSVYGLLWDLEIWEYYLDDGTSDAYDGVGYIFIEDLADEYWFEDDAGLPTLFVDDTVVVSGLDWLGVADEVEVSQVWFFPEDEGYARQTVLFTNTSGSPVTYDLWFDGDLGSDSDTTILATSSGDTEVDATDLWARSWDGGDDGDPHLGFVWGDGLLPISNDPEYGDGDDDLDFQFAAVTLDAGETVALVFFYVQGWTEAIVTDVMDGLYDDAPLTFYTGLTADQAGAIINFDVVDFDGDGENDEFLGGVDCNDNDAAINGNAVEVCDHLDNDCDGTVDEGVTTTFYWDLDGDGFGDDATVYEACDGEQDVFSVTVGGDCDDGDDDAFPGADEVCDGEDNDCDGVADEPDALDATTWYVDGDHDGFGDPAVSQLACGAPTFHVANGDDCDDAAWQVFPGADELCNGTDDDCDGVTDEDDAINATVWYLDADMDGFGGATFTALACDAPQGYFATADDCDDLDGLAYPGADEICNSSDDDCDGTVDEDDALDVLTWYEDLDGDGFGGAAVLACEMPVDHVADGTDCDDANALVFPGADELCNQADDDCNGVVDDDHAVNATAWFPDADGDSYGDTSAPAMACAAPPGHVADGTDCDDGAMAINPSMPELCNGVDDDCDGDVDEDDADDAQTWYADADGDGYGDAAVSEVACDAPVGFVADGTDCDDAEDDTHPGAQDVCGNGVDDDCSGAADEGCGCTDNDMDGSCIEDDCDDFDDDVYPDAPELCDGDDNDCDGDIDEDCPCEDNDGDGACADDDCDDNEDDAYPGNDEVCDDGIDNDCNGEVDEDCPCEDNDGDGSCADDDCDDYDDDVHPDATEVCGDGEDNDCDGDVDEDCPCEDNDGDGSCIDQDCDDYDNDVYPGADEVCGDGEDNNCDGEIDEEDCMGDADTCSVSGSATVSSFTPAVLALGLLALIRRRGA